MTDAPTTIQPSASLAAERATPTPVDAHRLGVRRHRRRRVHGAARPLHRQHRLPRDRAELPRQHALLALLGAERLCDRLRGAASSRPAGSPTFSAAAGPSSSGLIVFALASAALRAGADARRARRRPRRAGCRCGAPDPHLARPAAARLPACPAGGGDRRLGRRRRGRRRGGRPRRPARRGRAGS